MSIFRETFKPQIKGSLEARQKAMTDRTVDAIQYLNSRNSWIRMVSSVNINNSKTTASQNILQGGTLGPLGLKSGVGNSIFNAYSNKTPSGVGYRLGTRPMPGITSIEIKSKSAYGSLREVVVNFQCWDIHQLEELELLYMRPGYTVLVEWGWTPYLDNNGKIVTDPPKHYDIINKGATELSTIAKDLYNKSLASGGNYDATFGYIKNYQWSARPDGGYDCQTTIISTGEIIESLKVNYVRPDLLDYKMYDTTSNKGDGYLNPEFDPQGNILSTNFVQAYEKNTLAGIWSELFYKLLDPASKFKSGGIFKTIAADRGVDWNDLWIAFKDLKFNHVTTNTQGGIANNVGTWNVYITLDVALEFINKYVTAKSSKGEPLVKLSLTTSNITNTKSEELLCLAHPLQVSVDPSVCLISSPLWYQKSNSSNIIVNAGANTNVTNLLAGSQSIVAALKAASGINTKETDFINAVKQITSTAMFDAVELEMAKVKPQGKSTLAELINEQFEDDNLGEVQQIEAHLKQAAPNGPGLNVSVKTKNRIQSQSATTVIEFDPTGGGITISKGTSSNVSTAATVATGLPNALDAINILKDIKLPYFYGNSNGDDELGIIRNIYVNLDFLYRTATDANIESQDQKEKNEISLYKYVKSIMTAINSSLGSMNNFEVHVDPIDNNVARIIDINYTAPDKQSNLFELQVQNLNSVVRNYTLQSQIFPEQSSIIAIGSQVNGGQLGIQNNTMIDFNKNLKDRIIPEKEFPQQNTLHTTSKNNIGASLANIIILFANFKNIAISGAVTDLDSLYSKAKNSLRDIIVYFQSTVKSPSANRSIIPIKFSFETDGISGLVIGHLFKVNSGILPKGYKGANLAQTITGISHNVSNGDWTTKIDALNIILDDPASKATFSQSVDIKTVVANAVNALNSMPSWSPSTASTNVFLGAVNNVKTTSAQKTALWNDSNFRTKLQLICKDFNIAEIDVLAVIYAECRLVASDSLYKNPGGEVVNGKVSQFLSSPPNSRWKLVATGLIQWTDGTDGNFTKLKDIPGSSWTIDELRQTPAYRHPDINKVPAWQERDHSKYDQLDFVWQWFNRYRSSITGKDIYYIYAAVFYPRAMQYLTRDDSYIMGSEVSPARVNIIATQNPQIAQAAGTPNYISVGGFKRYVDSIRLTTSGTSTSPSTTPGVTVPQKGNPINIIQQAQNAVNPFGQLPGVQGGTQSTLKPPLKKLPRPKPGSANYSDYVINPWKYQ